MNPRSKAWNTEEEEEEEEKAEEEEESLKLQAPTKT